MSPRPGRITGFESQWHCDPMIAGPGIRMTAGGVATHAGPTPGLQGWVFIVGSSGWGSVQPFLARTI
eukprot:556694-Hanusia_phi.AAC.1